MSWLQSQICKLHTFIIFSLILDRSSFVPATIRLWQRFLAVLVWFLYLDSCCPFGCNGWFSSSLLPLQGHKSTGISSWALEVTTHYIIIWPYWSNSEVIAFWSGNITKTKNKSSALGHVTDMIEMRWLVSVVSFIQIYDTHEVFKYILLLIYHYQQHVNTS